MGYQELMKNYNIIRDVVRNLYVYGFNGREDMTNISERTYYYDLQRLNSWLKKYMTANEMPSKTIQVISIDCRDTINNPLYKIFKSKSFTKNDVLLYFCVLDLFKEKKELTKIEVVNAVQAYVHSIKGEDEDIKDGDKDKDKDEEKVVDDKTVELNLKKYTKLGILNKRKVSKSWYYSLNESEIDLNSWHDAIEFYSETTPLGVIGSFLLDTKELNQKKSPFWYKHHYILYAIDSEILEVILEGIFEKKHLEIKTVNKKGKENKFEVFPLKVYVSTQNGREYVLCHKKNTTGLHFIRLDNIKDIKLTKKCSHYEEIENEYIACKPYLWSVTSGKSSDISHLEMTLSVKDDEEFIIRRLEREKRNGKVFKLNDNQYKYVVDTYNVMELMPWIRTFIGRIDKLESSDPDFEKKFYEDLEQLYSNYFGGDEK